MGEVAAIEITKEAMAYIRPKTDAIKVEVVFFHGCGVGQKEGTIFEGRPSEPEKYDLVNIDGIDVYVQKDLVVGPEGLKISRSADFRAGLEVAGLEFERSHMQW